MSGRHVVYRLFIRLYPKPFRDAYGFDLEQHFDDLVRERGISAAWARTALDLAVTVPRYRLETIMNDRHTGAALGIAAFALCVAGVASTLVDFYSGALLLVVGVAVTQRNAAPLPVHCKPPVHTVDGVGSGRRQFLPPSSRRRLPPICYRSVSTGRCARPS